MTLKLEGHDIFVASPYSLSYFRSRTTTVQANTTNEQAMEMATQLFAATPSSASPGTVEDFIPVPTAKRLAKRITKRLTYRHFKIENYD